MIVYLDIVFLENIIMNYIILYATNYIIKRKVNIIKVSIASIIGGIYSIIVYLNILEIYSSLIMKIFLSVVMVYIGTNSKTIYKELLIFYMVSFVFGGAAFSIVYIMKPQNIFNIDGNFVGTYPIKIAIAGGLVGFVILSLVFKFIKRKLSRNNIICDLVIFLENKQIELKAMLDTGNLLKEPITGFPVIVVEKKALFDLIDASTLENIEKIMGGDEKIEISDKNILSRFKIIPYTSIGKQNGMLLGFRVDKVILKEDNQNVKIKDVIVAIYNKSFTKNKAYQALLGLDIIERRQKNEYITNFKK